MEYVSMGGHNVPKIGLGTWQLESETAASVVESALEVGYRHIDTAQRYDNEAGVGDGIASADIHRDELFVTTKVDPTHRTVEEIVASVEGSLERLGLETVDLLLIHWSHPLANLETVLAGLTAALDRGYTRQIGVSNFGLARLRRARDLSPVDIATNQVLFHPWWPQSSLRDYCAEHEIVLTAYSPLAGGHVIGDSVLETIGEKYGKSPAQVALRWAIEHDTVAAIPKTTSTTHLRENLSVFDFSLTADERSRIERRSMLRTGWALARQQVAV